MATELDASVLKAKAAAKMGLADFGADPFAKNFARFIESVNDDGVLSPAGRDLTETEILRELGNGLEIRACLSEHPEILRETIDAPVFLMGLPRSGTTFLQNLFHCDENLRVLRTWETLHPSPPPATDAASVTRRIEEAAQHMARWRSNVDKFDAIHLLDAVGPDECSLLLNIAYAQVGFQNYLRVPGLFDWLLDSADFTQVYRFHRNVLQLLQWKADRRRWALKYPNHMVAMTEIRTVYPDSVFIVTHRDPLQTLASICSLTERFRAARYENVDRHDVGREMLHFVHRHIDRFLEFRAGPGGNESVVDVDYYRLVADPVSTVAEIYQRAGLTMTDSVRGELSKWTAANPKGRRGTHDYRFADYGLDLDDVEARFAPYRQRFGIRREHGYDEGSS
jgi:hypothetical protein